MRSIKFPKMFSTSSTNVWKSSEYVKATTQNTILLLNTSRGELFGDPYFGVLLKRYLFDQNNYILRDAIIDVIYTQLALFIPQIKVRREDINIVQDREKGKLYCEFSGISQIDYTNNTYNLILFDEQN
jgi:phage baseplate assembly protein W